MKPRKENKTMELIEVMKSRHSVRQYQDKPIEEEKKAILDTLIAEINQENNLHIQAIYDEPKCFDSFMAHYGKFSGVKNYIALIKKKSDPLDETLCYQGERIVLKAQELGLNTCFVALTHGKSKAVIQKGEKLVCLIALGYGVTQGVSHQSKPIEKASNAKKDSPSWFLDGVKSALLAPTAMNQQKFRFELQEDGQVKRSTKGGFYTKLDLGIANCHFEMISGKKTIE